MIGLTNSLARQFGPDNIRVNAIAPGAVITERQRRLWISEDDLKAIVARQCLHRVLLADEIARAALFLASDDSAMITKQLPDRRRRLALSSVPCRVADFLHGSLTHTESAERADGPPLPSPGDRFERRGEFSRDIRRADAVAMGRLRPRGFHRDLDREHSVGSRHGDVRHGVRLDDHQSQRQIRWRCSLVQVAVSLPLFLFTLPAGALADVIDSRRLLIVVEVAVLAISVVLAVLVSLGLASVSTLLLTTFLLGVGGALTAPAWQSITPLLVPRQDLDGAVAANSVGFNVSRAVGPALGGIVIAALGIASPFWIFCLGNLAIIASLIWWRAPRKGDEALPAERLTSAVRNGVRYAANNAFLRATLMRTLAFFPFASAYWALLPLVARNQAGQGPELYGILLGAIGAGAIGGSFVMNWLKARLGPDRVVEVGTLATALALILFGLAHDSYPNAYRGFLAVLAGNGLDSRC